MAIEYGYIRWLSTLTGKEGGVNVPVANPSGQVTLLNAKYRDLKYWFVSTSVHLPAMDQGDNVLLSQLTTPAATETFQINGNLL